MASIIRTSFRQMKSPFLINVRMISESKQKSNTTTMPTAAEPKLVKRRRDWNSHGFDLINEVDDLNIMHSHFFFCVSILLVGGAYVLIYYPDLRERAWAQREAYIELRRRESQGLPLIDRNYVDPANLYLPSDDELGDFEIIV